MRISAATPHGWPGNIPELRNPDRTVVIMVPGPVIDPALAGLSLQARPVGRRPDHLRAPWSIHSSRNRMTQLQGRPQCVLEDLSGRKLRERHWVHFSHG